MRCAWPRQRPQRPPHALIISVPGTVVAAEVPDHSTDWSGSIGITGRDQSDQLIGMGRYAHLVRRRFLMAVSGLSQASIGHPAA
jgi:hypothetical protein